MTEIAAVNLNGRWGVAHGGEQAAGVACGGRMKLGGLYGTIIAPASGRCM